jgi:hypothetical protein
MTGHIAQMLPYWPSILYFHGVGLAEFGVLPMEMYSIDGQQGTTIVQCDMPPLVVSSDWPLNVQKSTTSDICMYQKECPFYVNFMIVLYSLEVRSFTIIHVPDFWSGIDPFDIWVKWIKSSKCYYEKYVVHLYIMPLCKSQVKAFTTLYSYQHGGSCYSLSRHV